MDDELSSFDESDGRLAALGQAFAGRRHTATAEPAGWIVIDPDGGAASRLVAAFARQASAAGAVVVGGAFRPGLLRPFGGLLEVVDGLTGLVSAEEPELLDRYSLALVNLLPAWREPGLLENTRELRSGLADFVLHGELAGLKDFYWKRDVSPWIVAEVVHLVLAAAAVLSARSGSPTVLCLEDIHLADPATVSALALLGRYAARAPVLLCATATDLSGEGLAALVEEERGEQGRWRTLRAAGDPGAGGRRDVRPLAGTAEEDRRLLAAAAVLALPFTAADLARLAPGAERVEEWLEHQARSGRLRRMGRDRFTVAAARLRQALLDGLDPEELGRLHVTALAVESQDPFAAAWHALATGSPDAVERRCREALERSWGVSDFACAIALAGHVIAAADGNGLVDGDLLLALLHYDAGHSAETERLLLRALERQRSAHEHNRLRRLLGYNAIFGLGHFDHGREILAECLKFYKAEGREQDAGFVRNSMAFALFRVGRFDDAIEMENSALALLQSSAQPGAFLFSILQLNLGRLYRNLGFSERALELFKQAMEGPNTELSPYMLLIFHATLAHLHAARGEHAEVLADYHHCLELARDLDLENAGYPVLNLLSSSIGPILAGRLTRGDELFSYLYLHLALTCRRLGLAERADAYLAGMRGQWDFLGEELWRAAESVLAACAPAPVAAPHSAAEFRRHADEVEHRFAELVREVSGHGRLAERAAEALAAGLAVAVVRPREVGANVHLVDSVVLFDPRQPSLARRLNAEVGVSSGLYPPASGYGSSAARAAVALPEALDRFGQLAPLPLVLHEATVEPRWRGELPALTPYRVRLQVLSPDFDGMLHEVLVAFARRTGLGVLAAVPFHLRRRAMALSPEKGLTSFLVSPVDCLLLGDRLLAKVHGATADRNLLPFRPRLSRQASVVEGPRDARGSGTVVVVLRTWAYQTALKLSREARPILELCDGRRSVGEVVESLTPAFAGRQDWEEQICGLFRELSRHGVICFDEPLPEAVLADAALG